MWLVTPKGDMLNLAVAHEIRTYDYDDASEVVLVMRTYNVTVLRGTAEQCKEAVEHIAMAITADTPVIHMNTKGA